MIFEENMTYPEALKVFFRATDGKSKKEIEQIQSEFKKIISVIVNREIDGSPKLTNH